MAPSFDNLREDDGEDSEEEIDFSGICIAFACSAPEIDEHSIQI